MSRDGSPQIGSITAALDHEAQQEEPEKTNEKRATLKVEFAPPSPVRNASSLAINGGGSQESPLQYSRLPTAPHQAYGNHYAPPPYGFHVARSPIGYPHPNMYSNYRPDMYPPQRHLPLGSPPEYNPTTRGMYYPQDVAMKQKDQWNLPNAPSHNHAKPAAVKQEPDEHLHLKGPLLRSPPPPKKRRVHGSWDDQDRNLDVGAASPGMFRSPPCDAKMRGRHFGLVSVIICFKPCCATIFHN